MSGTLNAVLMSLCLAALLSASVRAGCPADCPEGFSYEKSDYSQITDWSKVEWNKIPKERIPDVPADALKYEALSAEQRNAMAAPQIAANFEKIEDLANDVDKRAAESAIYNTYGIIVDLGKGAKIRRDVLSATYGDEQHVSLQTESYRQGMLSVDEKGEIVFVPGKDQTSIAIPATDSVHVVTTSPLGNVQVGNVKVDFFSGVVDIRNGNIVVPAGDLAVINHVQVFASGTSDVPVYFDDSHVFDRKRPIAENFVSLGSRLVASGDGFSLLLLPGGPYKYGGDEYKNTYLPVNGDYQNDLMRFTLDKGAIEITKRYDDNNMPLMQTSGKVTVDNDKNTVSIEGDKVDYYPRGQRYLNKEEEGAVWFELTTGDKAPHYFFDDNGNIAVQNEEKSNEMARARKSIKDTYGVDMEGYISPKELYLLEDALDTLTLNGMIVPSTLGLTRIYAIDRREAPSGSEAFSRRSESGIAYWAPYYDLDVSTPVGLDGEAYVGNVEELTNLYKFTLLHEIGHIAAWTYSPQNTAIKATTIPKWREGTFEGSWAGTFEQWGVKIQEESGFVPGTGGFFTSRITFDKTDTNTGQITDAIYSDPKKGTVLLTKETSGGKNIPSYGTTNLGESQAELFKMIFYDQAWFTDETRVEGPLPKGVTKTKILEYRRKLRTEFISILLK